MKKKLKPIVYYTSIFFGLFWAKLSDCFTDKYKLYYFFDKGVIEGKTVILFLGIYPAAIMMIINWFPYTKAFWRKFLYMMAWALFSTFFEWLTLKSGVLHYLHWRLWYSIISYPILYSGLIFNVYCTQWLTKETFLRNDDAKRQ